MTNQSVPPLSGIAGRKITSALRVRYSFSFEDVMGATVVFLGALCLAFKDIEYRSIWRDEGVTLEAISGSWRTVPGRWFAQDFVMGLYFTITKAWVGLLGGRSPRSLRATSALCIALLMVVCWFTVRHLSGYRGALVALPLLLTSQVLLLAGHDARAYALVALLGASSYFALVRGLERGGDCWAFAVFATLTSYAHPLGVLAPVGMLLGAFLRADGPTRRWLVRAGVIAGVLVIPLAVAQLHARTGLFWLSRPSLSSLRFSAQWLLVGFGPTGAQLLRAAVLLLGAVLAVASIIRLPSRGKRRQAAATESEVVPQDPRDRAQTSLAALVGWAVVPSVALLIATYIHEPIFVDRYVLVSVPAVLMLAAIGIARLPLVLCLAIGVVVVLAWAGPTAKAMRWQANENWWGAFRASTARQLPGDVVLAGDGWPVLSHYFSLQSRPRPEQVYAIWPKATDTRPFARRPGVDIDASLAELPSERTIWLYTFEGEPFDSIRPLGDALARTRTVGYDELFGLVRVRSFLPTGPSSTG